MSTLIEGNFSYNGISSKEMNMKLILNDKKIGNLKELFLVQKKKNDGEIKYHTKHYLYGKDYLHYTVTLNIKSNSKINKESFKNRNKLIEWLCPDAQMHPLISDKFPTVVFWVKFKIKQFNNQFGTIFKAIGESNLPYPLSPIECHEWDLSNNIGSTKLTIKNKCKIGDYFIPDQLEFTLIGNNTSFKLVNHTNKDESISFTGLNKRETITIDSVKNVTSDMGLCRLSNCDLGFEALKLPYGVNQIEIFGQCKLRVKMQFPMQL